MTERDQSFVLTLSCRDRVGIVHAVSGFLAERGCNITDSAQFGDRDTGRFFMRVSFDAPHEPAAVTATDLAALRHHFAEVGARFDMAWRIGDAAIRPRVLILVSRFGHCLNDLLYRHRIGALPIDLRGVVSNHEDFRPLAESYGADFACLPVTPQTKPAREAELLDRIAAERVDLVVLARYMQVLSERLTTPLAGRIINIHHSFLPSFKGARPYQQAHDRGVKLIGATAHYVTAGLDEGPIIEQETARVDHAMTPEDLAAVGRDLESIVLARAVKMHVEHRVLLNGSRTVVFR